MKIKQSGMTLIDLMMTIGIASILLGSGIPSFYEFISKQKIISETQILRGHLTFARKTAITYRQKVTVCPTSNSQQCDKDWSDGYMIFIDQNENRVLDGDEKILREVTLKDDVQLRWRAFGVRTSLQWHETGITNHQNGTFELCYQNDPELARALIITKAGRIRTSKDTNNDGVHENATGKALKCN